MLSPSLAFTWVLWRHHGTGLATVLAYLAATATLSAILPPYCTPDLAKDAFAALFSASLNGLVVYFLGIFTYGIDSAELLDRQSCFPAALLRLPVRTSSLVLWPLACGAAAVILLWLVLAGLILRPWLEMLHEKQAPLWWPALFGAATLAWVQALFWSPLGLPGMRCVLIGGWMLVVIPLTVIGAGSGVSEALLAALFAGLALAGWGVAYVGVQHARRGDVPDWAWLLRPVHWLAQRLSRRQTSFVSAARAQVWLEWRLSGNSLPIMTALMLPAALWPLFFGKNDVLPAAQVVLGVLGVPVLLAGMAGGGNRWSKDRTGLIASIATLPMSSTALVGAMLKAAAWSVLAAWVLVALALPLTVVLTGKADEIAEWWQRGLHELSAPRMMAGLAAAALLLFVWTWKRKVDGMYFGFTGRTWVDALILIVYAPGFLLLCIGAVWIYPRPETHAAALVIVPRLFASMLVLRIALAGWVLRLAVLRGLLRMPTLSRWLICWLLLAATLIGGLAWAVPPALMPVHQVALAVLCVMPMVRLSAAPLALAWNRHR